jgi:hypothetical protein
MAVLDGAIVSFGQDFAARIGDSEAELDVGPKAGVASCHTHMRKVKYAIFFWKPIDNPAEAVKFVADVRWFRR